MTPRISTLLPPAFVLLLAALPGLAQTPAGNTSPPAPAGNASPQAPGGFLRRSPPQPQQKQSLDYFVGRWNATWSGRESAFSPGPRTGTLTFGRLGASNFLTVRGEGKTEAGDAYAHEGTLGWHDAQKIVALSERLPNGIHLLSVGDWTSPIAIRFESAPVAAPRGGPDAGKTLTLRRSVGIVSAQSFTITEELSIDGQPFVRIGSGVFGKAAARE